MSEVFDFLRRCGTFFVLTCDGDEPAGRPFGAVMEREGKLYISTGQSKAVYRQMKKNPRVQITAIEPGTRTWLRLRARAEECADADARRAMFTECPRLQMRYAGPEDAEFALFCLIKCEAWRCTDAGKERMDAPAETEPTEELPISALERETNHESTETLRFHRLAAPRAMAAAAVHGFPTDEDMRSAAAQLGRETVFFKCETDGSVSVRCFTGAGEQSTDTDAITLALSCARDREKLLVPGTYIVRTLSGFIQANVGEELVWTEAAAFTLRRMLSEEEDASLRAALGVFTGKTELRSCLAGDVPLVLMEVSGGAEATALSKAPLPVPDAAGVLLYTREADGETVARARLIAENVCPTGAAASLLAGWLHLLRRAPAEGAYAVNGERLLTSAGPDGRLFIAGTVEFED